MLEFSFEIMSESNINIEYVYGSEMFKLNLFLKNGYWTIHPFDGMLLQNRELCKLVIIDLFKNKYFQIMLAKENIALSSLRTSIELDPSHERQESNPAERRGGRWQDPVDETEEFIGNHSIEEIIQIEHDALEQRVTFYADLLKKMFMDNYGPGDHEFDKVQSLVRILKESQAKMMELTKTV
ncbi:hypothetical protein [Paenibacillus qinlingensis]|uniref:Uncharacterized protein n=1 Tax=Paenibacillus qinlingensis TaxID=1837343 RepID=A0ABU1P7H4_9BACL|nr:hypothetical protein [Paenibacillus qinlingensis]MDR6554992.1 hypothetical protein [Paenibacillus qinlingensis]